MIRSIYHLHEQRHWWFLRRQGELMANWLYTATQQPITGQQLEKCAVISTCRPTMAAILTKSNVWSFDLRVIQCPRPAMDFYHHRLFSRSVLHLPRSEGWSHHEHTSSIYLCPLPFWLTLLWWVLSTSWCRPSRLCVVFLACDHLPLFLVVFSLSMKLAALAIGKLSLFVL